MKKMILIALLSIYIGSSNLCIGQETKLDVNNISEWIYKKKPLFLTGTSSNIRKGNMIPSLLSAIASSAKRYEHPKMGQLRTASSVALIHKNEIVMAPIGLRLAIYPITIYNDSVVICVRSPKTGGKYADVNSYELNDFVIFTKNAINLNEISDKPYEMSSMYVDRFFYTVRNVVQKNGDGPIDLSCFVQSFLNKYTWPDEFLRQDYLNEYTKVYNSFQPFRPDMTKPNSLKSIYIDFEAKLDEYAFGQSAFPMAIGRIIGVSPSIEGFGHNIDLLINDKSISIEKQKFAPGEEGYDSYDFIDQFILDENERWSYEKYMLPMNTDRARSFASNLNEERTIKVRIVLEPIRVTTGDKKPLCGDRWSRLESIPFTAENFIVLQ